MKKASNIIVIGGMIAAGKSSLVGSLPFKAIQELDPNDELQNVLISKMYEGDDIAKQVFQLDIMLSRFDKYKNAVQNKDNKFVFDRSIFEDWIFAKLLLSKIPNVWEYYDSIWNDKINEMVNELGIPELYLILDINWETFMKRIFIRNRKSEVDNFNKNESYFKELFSIYLVELKRMLDKYNIPYIIVDVNDKDKLSVINEAKNILFEKGLINDK